MKCWDTCQLYILKKPLKIKKALRPPGNPWHPLVSVGIPGLGTTELVLDVLQYRIQSVRMHSIYVKKSTGLVEVIVKFSVPIIVSFTPVEFIVTSYNETGEQKLCEDFLFLLSWHNSWTRTPKSPSCPPFTHFTSFSRHGKPQHMYNVYPHIVLLGRLLAAISVNNKPSDKDNE